MKDGDRLPIAEYASVCWRLAYHLALAEGKEDAIDIAVQITADIFWVSAEKVWRDVRHAYGSVRR